MAQEQHLPPRPMENRRVLETSGEARQAGFGRPVLIVLPGGITLAGLYLLGMTIWASVSTPPAAPEGTVTPGATGDLRPRVEPNMSDIPPANPAYPAPVEK